MGSRGSLTQLKLDEARFFLDQLKPNYGRERKFDFYLSAFISAARSVTWVMGAEYSEVPGWRDWFGSLAPSKEEEALLKGTNQVRIRTQKLGPLQTMLRVAVDALTVPEELAPRLAEAITKSPSGAVPVFLGGSKGEYFVDIAVGEERFRVPATTVIIERKLEEFPGSNIVDVCDAYYAYLELVVRQCREKFAA